MELNKVEVLTVLDLISYRLSSLSDLCLNRPNDFFLSDWKAEISDLEKLSKKIEDFVGVRPVTEDIILLPMKFDN